MKKKERILDKRGNMKILTVLLISMLFYFPGAAEKLEIQVNEPSIQDQWAHSPHAGSMNTPEEQIKMNKTGCAHCHTAQGYWEVILEGKESTAPYENPTGLDCLACHDFTPDLTCKGCHGMKIDGKPTETPLRAGKVENACTGCHDILVQNDTEDFSSCPQGSLLKGKGGAEFNGKTYKTGGHSKVEKNCAGCHMAASPGGKDALELGGHTFRVITKGKTPRVFNPNGCTPCHDNMTYEFVKNSQAKYKKLMETLRDLLPQKPKGTAKSPDQSPKFPKDPSLNKIEAMAAYNYYQVLKDGTYGVHNPVYIKKLLEDSIDALGKR